VLVAAPKTQVLIGIYNRDERLQLARRRYFLLNKGRCVKRAGVGHTQPLDWAAHALGVPNNTFVLVPIIHNILPILPIILPILPAPAGGRGRCPFFCPIFCPVEGLRGQIENKDERRRNADTQRESLVNRGAKLAPKELEVIRGQKRSEQLVGMGAIEPAPGRAARAKRPSAAPLAAAGP
jgi:hypothetical protein